MPSTLAFVPSGRLPRLPWFRRLVDFVDSHFGHQRSAGHEDPADTDFPDTVTQDELDARTETESLLGIDFPDDDDPETRGMSGDQRYFYGLARRKLLAGAQTNPWHHQNSRPQ